MKFNFLFRERGNAQPFNRYFPIPYEQIQLSSPGVLKQNEGYN